MCLAVPAKIISINENTGRVEFGSVRRNIDLRLISEVQEGDYVLVHAGFAIEKLDKDEAEKTLQLFNELTIAMEDLG